jgi:hypothetical protein
MKFSIISDGVTHTVSVYIDGRDDPYKIQSNDSAFVNSIAERVIAGDDTVLDLFNTGSAINSRLVDQKLSDRISVSDGELLFDGDVVDDAIADQIIGFLEDDVDDWYPLVLFLEKLYANQSESVRKGLYTWISQQKLTITEDGNFLGFKGLNNNYTSIHAGPGVVNGVKTSGNLDNTPGNVIEVARSYVDDNEYAYCSTGLHVGTRQYATGFARGKVVVCEVDPRNVVSVPYDGHEKIRTSKYTVVEDAADDYNRVHSIQSNKITVNKIVAGTITVGKLNGPTRDAKGRFVKGGQTHKRDAQGRFIKS